MYTPKVITHPSIKKDSCDFFSDLDKAKTHIADHLLTRDECYYWIFKSQDLNHMTLNGDSDRRFKIARKMFRNDLALFEKLYEIHFDLSSELFENLPTEWLYSDEEVFIGMTLEGVIFIISQQEQTVKTIYLAGRSNPAFVQRSNLTNEDRTTNPLPREPHKSDLKSSWKYMKKVRKSNHSTIQRRKPKERREGHDSDEDFLFYLFKNAFRFVRNQTMNTSRIMSRPLGNDLVKLKGRLPDRCPDRDGWKILREQKQAKVN